MGFQNTVVACYYTFNQSLVLQAEIKYKAYEKYIEICGFEELKQAPISKVAKLLLSSGYEIVINPHEPLKAEIDTDYRVTEIKLDLENTVQYDDLLASLNIENKLSNLCNITYEKPYKRSSLYLLLQGCIEELKPTFLDTFSLGNKDTLTDITEAFSDSLFNI